MLIVMPEEVNRCNFKIKKEGEERELAQLSN